MSSGSLHKSCIIFSFLLKQYGVYVHIICGPFMIRVTGIKSVYLCPFVHMCYAPKPLNIIQSNIMCNQLPVMCPTHGERTIITVRYQREYVKHKLDEQTDSHSGYSAHVHDWSISWSLVKIGTGLS